MDINTQAKLDETRRALDAAQTQQQEAQNRLTYWTTQTLLLQGRLSAWQEFHPAPAEPATPAAEPPLAN